MCRHFAREISGKFERFWLFRIFGGLLGRLFSHSARASHGVTSKEDGKRLMAIPSAQRCGEASHKVWCAEVAGSTPNVVTRLVCRISQRFSACFFIFFSHGCSSHPTSCDKYDKNRVPLFGSCSAHVRPIFLFLTFEQGKCVYLGTFIYSFNGSTGSP